MNRLLPLSFSPPKDKGTSWPSESSVWFLERLFKIRLLFILKSMEKMRESCTNSCSHWCSQVAPKIGTAGEKSGSSVLQCQGQAGGGKKELLEPQPLQTCK